MQVKSYPYQSICEWSNSKTHSQLLACAQLSPDQSNLYNLDILSLDLSDRSKNLNQVGNSFYNVPFRCLAWDTFGEKQNHYPAGVIFGGMDDGSYTLWNAHQMISTFNRNNINKNQQNIEMQTSFLYGQQAEEDAYPIMCAEWNALKNNLLAFGSTDLLILDIGKDISAPQIKKPGNRNPHQGSYITSVSWNKQVANILASASENGLIALWDIKGNKSIFEFKDSPSTNNGNRNVVICWSKTISTQLAVTLDDQKRNQLQIWDLRNQKGPVAVFDRGHTKGINTMEWCETDPDLIMTGGRDNRVVCWNYTQEEGPISAYDLDNPLFDIKWSKKLKSIYALSLQNRTQIYSLDDANLFNYVPKWYKVPIGSTFNGNESLLQYSQSVGNKLIEAKLSSLVSSQNSNLQSLLGQLQNSFQQSPLSKSINDFWKLIQAKSSQSDDSIYDYLGYNKQKIIKQVQKYTGKKRENVHVKAQQKPKSKSKAYTPVIGQEAASFFASIGETQNHNSGMTIEEDQDQQNVKYDMVPRNFNWNTGKERLIKHNILIGNHQGAIDAAIKCGRTAQALIIAYSVDQNTFNSTLKTFFTQTTDPFITDVLKNLTYRDNEQLVRKFNLDHWKECVAIIYSISTSEKRKHLLNLLAQRIREQSLQTSRKVGRQIVAQDNPAIQCYILSQNFNEIANLYYENLRTHQSGTTLRKQTVVEYAKRLILIFNTLSIELAPCKNFDKIIREAAFIATQENFNMVAYLLMTNFIYQSSCRQIDMIIHATKSLQQYRSSIVFNQINIPVMQVKQQQAQKNKKGTVQVSKTVQRQSQNPPQQANLPQNPNLPTKDKQNQRPPIFNKRQDAVQVKNTPPPPTHNKPRNTPYEEEPEQPQQKKNVHRKIPPAPGFKNPQNQNESPQSNQNIRVSQGPHHPNQQKEYEQVYEQNTQKKNPPPPPTKGKKVPPPPSFIGHQASQEQKSSYPQQQNNQVKKNVPKPHVNNETRIPPPPPHKQQFTRQQVQYEQDEQQQPVVRSKKNIPQSMVHQLQQHNTNITQIKKGKSSPPPPSPSLQKPLNNAKQQQSYDQQNQQYSDHSNRIQESSNINRSIPPPNKRPSNQYQNEPQQYQNQQYQQPQQYQNQSYHEDNQTSIVRVQQNQGFSGKQPSMKSRVPPPPPPTMQVPQKVQTAIKNNVQQRHQQAPQQHQEQYQEEQQYEQVEQPQTPVIKRPPPPVSGKKGPPPPPRR